MNTTPRTREKPPKRGLLPGNAAALKAHHPLALRQILAGLPASPCPLVVEDPGARFSLRIGDVHLHSTTQPVVEAQGLATACGAAESSSVIVFGFGAGYVLDAACQAAPPNGKIYLVVIDPQAFVSTLRHRDVSATLSDPRLSILIGDLQTVAAAMPQVDESLVVLAHEPILQAAAAPALQPLAHMARELSATQRSRRAQFLDVLNNIERNLERILSAGSVRDLVPLLSGRPALLVAPGPSLDAQLALLSSRPLPLLVALDTSLRPLATAGIQPDLAVTLDPTPANVAKFENVDLPCPLVFFGGSRPEALACARQAVLACEQDGLLERAHPWFARGGRFRSGGSVLLAALEVLLAAGADPIVLVGADLAHTGGRGHASGARRRETAGASAPRGDQRRVPRRGGGTIVTSESLWRHWRRLTRRLEQLPRGRVLDATADGAELASATRVDLETWLSGFAPADLAPSSLPFVISPEPAEDIDDVRDAAVAAINRARSW